MPLSKELKKFIDDHINNTEDSLLIVDKFLDLSIKEREDLIDYLLEQHQVDWIIDTFENLEKDLAEQDSLGNTLLHYAVKNNHDKVVKLILEADNISQAIEYKDPALTEIRNNQNQIPFDLVRLANPNLITALEKYKAMFNRRREELFQSPLKQPSRPRLGASAHSFAPTCGKPHLSTAYSTTETTIRKHQTGTTPQWEDAACLPQYDWLSKSTGQLVWKNLTDSSTLNQNVSNQRWGSGCLIADNLFLTAAHCFDPLNKDGGWKLSDALTGSPLQSTEFTSLMTVNFNYQLATCPTTDSKKSHINEKEFNIRRLVEHRVENLDYAILELEGLPGQTFGKVQLSTALPRVGEEVIIAQHPHGEVKKVHYGPTLCKTPLCGVGDGKIYYRVDTEPGSSGSPVALPNEETVIGVHTDGFNKTSFQANSAVSIFAIKQVSNVLNNKKFGFFSNTADNQKQPSSIKPKPPLFW